MIGFPLSNHLSVRFWSAFFKVQIILPHLVQTTLTLTKHIKSKSKQACTRIGLIGNLQKLDMKTNISIFNIAIWPVLTYAFKAISRRITCKNLIDLDVVKDQFVKRSLGVPKNASLTLAFKMEDTPRIGSQIISGFNIKQSVI